MIHVDLFSGIGGFRLAGQMVWRKDFQTVVFCEKDSFCRRVLYKHWPEIPCVEEIYEFNGYEYFESTDLITAGFPCQPFSVAGKQRGSEDDRYLWPETLRVVHEVQPRWFLGENVPGLISVALDTVLFDLESEGYEVETLIVPACAVDARHRRDRVWIVAHSQRHERRSTQSGRDAETQGIPRTHGTCHRSPWQPCGTSAVWQAGQEYVPDSAGKGLEIGKSVSPDSSKKCERAERDDCCSGISQTRDWREWEPEPQLGRVANGVSNRVDRLRSLGNAIVPQVAAVIMKYMKEVDSYAG